MKVYSGSGGIASLILNLLTRWLASRSGRFTARKRAPGTQWIGGWFGPGADLVIYGEEIHILPLPRFEPRIVQPVVHSLYWSLFLGSQLNSVEGWYWVSSWCWIVTNATHARRWVEWNSNNGIRPHGPRCYRLHERPLWEFDPRNNGNNTCCTL